jgi:hypothetical protein
MKARLIGSRATPFGRARLLAFHDHVELLSGGGLWGWEVRRLFFDDLTCATARSAVQWGNIVAGGTLSLLLLVFGLALLPYAAVAGGIFGLAGAGGLVAAAIGVFVPPHELKIHAPGQALVTLLPRDGASRERALGELQRAIDVYQNRGARVPTPAPPVEPA